MKLNSLVNMKDTKSFKPTLLLAAILFTIASFRDAWAYLDPGTGSYVLQLILAAALGAALTVKMWWAKFVGLFRRAGKPVHSNPHDNG